jgi:hypothetical protein
MHWLSPSMTESDYYLYGDVLIIRFPIKMNFSLEVLCFLFWLPISGSAFQTCQKFMQACPRQWLMPNKMFVHRFQVLLISLCQSWNFFFSSLYTLHEMRTLPWILLFTCSIAKFLKCITWTEMLFYKWMNILGVSSIEKCYARISWGTCCLL